MEVFVSIKWEPIFLIKTVKNPLKINLEIDQELVKIRKKLCSAHVKAFIMGFEANHYIATNYSIQALECLAYGCNFSPLG